MSTIKQTKITQRLMYGFGVLMSIFLLFGGFNLYHIKKVSNLNRIIYNHPMVVSNAALQTNASVAKMHRSMKDVVLFHSPARIQESIESVIKEEKKVFDYLKIIENKILGEKGKELERNARKIFEEWQPIRNEVIGLVNNNQRKNAAKITIGKGANHVVLLEEKMLGLTNYAIKKAAEFTEASERGHSKLYLASFLFLLIGMLMSLLVAVFTLKFTKSAEKNIRESENKYRQIFDTNQAVKLIIDPQDGSIIEANKAACSYYGYSKKNMQTINISDINVLPPDKVHSEMQKAKTENRLYFNFSHRLASGEERDVEVYSGPVVLGEKIVLYSVIHDVTDRVLAEEALKESEYYFSQIFEQSSTSMCLYNPDGTFKRVNDEFCKMFGVEAKGIINSGYNVLTNQAVIDTEVLPLLREVFDGKKNKKWEINFDMDIASASGRIPTSETGKIYLEVYGHPILNNRGDLEYVVLQHHDITERKQAEDALRGNEKYLDNIINNIGDPVFVKDDQSRLLSVNDSFCRLFGLTKDDILGKTLAEEVPPDERESFLRIDNQVLTTGQENITEESLTVRGGQTQTISTRKTRFVDNNGKKFLVGVIRDITEHKQAQEALRESEEKLHLIIDTSPIGICTVDPIGNFVTTNLAYEHMVGYSKEELRGLSFFDVTHPDNRPKNKKLFQDMFSLKTTNFFMEKRYIRKDGAMIEVAVHANGIMDAEGNARFGTAFVEDITERKQAEDELRQYEQIVSSTKDMLALIDKNFVFLSANLAYMKAFAKTSDQLIGRTVTDVFGEEFFSKVIRPRAERCMAGENIRYQDWFDFPATGRRYMDIVYSSFIVPDAGVLGFVVTARDITEYASIQGQLAQAQKMESVGQLAGGVAHDYNNISSIIIGYSELALEQIEQSDPLHDDLTEILTAAKRSTDITRQLLAFARKQTIAPKVLDLNDTIGSMLKMLRRLIGEDIDLAWLPGAKVWPVKMDPSQVDQILANLAVNARDAIADVGKVTVETKNISFDEEYCADHAGFIPGEYVLLAVSDDGGGIAPDILNKIFEPFFTTKELGKGTGLGLSTVYGIVKQNNGFINIYSEPKKGTTIKIYLSRHEGQAVEAYSDNIIEIPISLGETVLLVEDDGSILKLGKRILEELGYRVLSAASPSEAIKLAEEHADEISLLITDVIMPEMNGRELSEHLQNLYPNLKIIFMSGYTANVIAHRGVLDDDVFFISKPFSKKEMAVKVREVLDETKGSA